MKNYDKETQKLFVKIALTNVKEKAIFVTSVRRIINLIKGEVNAWQKVKPPAQRLKKK